MLERQREEAEGLRREAETELECLERLQPATYLIEERITFLHILRFVQCFLKGLFLGSLFTFLYVVPFVGLRPFSQLYS